MYFSQTLEKPFEVEHIWADKYIYFREEFPNRVEFERFRNQIGGLILLPQGINQSLNDNPYVNKIDAYFGQNLLAKSLHPFCYQKNPSFLK